MKQLKCISLCIVLVAMICLPQLSYAVSGDYTDNGGGRYHADVYCYRTTDNMSYEWCTGENGNDAMGKFIGFESENGAVATTARPGIKLSFRCHYPQANDWDFEDTEYWVYVYMADGSWKKIGHKGLDSVRLVNDEPAYATLVSPSISDRGNEKWGSFRMFLNQKSIDRNIKSIVVIGFAYYHQDNFWSKDRNMVIYYRYDKDITMDYTSVPEPAMTWSKPGLVQLTMDHSAVPDPDADQYHRNLGTGNPEHRNGIGTADGEYIYSGIYKVSVLDANGNVIEAPVTYEHTGNTAKTIDINVPLDKSFKINVQRSTAVKMRINYWSRDDYSTYWNITENIPGTITSYTSYNNDPLELTASFNQVTGDVRLSWEGQVSPDEGDFKIYRTTVDEYGNYKTNRKLLATTARDNYTDGAEQGLEYGKRYRYEVFQHKNSWGDVQVPTSPETLTSPPAGEAWVNTMPVIPLKLMQDATATDRVKLNWDFGGIPNRHNTVSFAVNRIDPDGKVNLNYGTVVANRTDGKASFEDTTPESRCDVYSYYVTTSLVDDALHYSSDTISAHVLDGSVVTGMTVSKGNYSSGVRITWTAKQVGSLATAYDVKRRFIGDREWITIYSTQGTSSEYTFMDETAEVGRYYEYRVTAYGTDCDGMGNMVVSNYMEQSGFGQSSGVIAGRVTFETGTAVSGVKVSLQRNDDENDSQHQFSSRQIMEPGDGITWTPLMSYAQNIFAADKPYTVQLWFNPDESFDDVDGNPAEYAKLLSLDGLFEVRLYPDADGHRIEFYMAGDTQPRKTLATAPFGMFSHITIRYNGDGNYDLIHNGKTFTTVNVTESYALTNHDGKAEIWFGGHSGEDMYHCFTGYIDDVRIWNRALSNDEIGEDIHRILNGRENGLKAYYTFDENLSRYAYDASYTNGVPNSNHPELGLNTRPSYNTPSADQLSLYGITNNNGEYIIRGIPFTGSGTGYTVRPLLGEHEFSPTSRTGFISASSLSLNSYDFSDVSSFAVSGTIRYAGTTVPVDSVMFYVDGTPCTRDGKTIYSDANGEYTISVPIGEHYIEIKRNGHTFENDGRYPAVYPQRFDFRSETHLDFFDNTLVNFSGRITGGATQGNVPLGYGKSENTIGQATIKLTMLDHPQRRINVLKRVQGTTVEWIDNPDPVEAPSASNDIRSYSWRGYNDPDEVKAVYITTDSLTGEFSAMLPPLRYTVESVKFASNSELGNDDMFRNLAAIDLTNPLDSVRPDTLWNDSRTNYLPLYRSNKRMMLTYRSQPVFEVMQTGAPAGAFGTDTIFMGDNHEIALPLYTVDEQTGAVNYTYGYPIFQQHREYEYKIKLYEPYVNYDRDPQGRVYQDFLADSIITINNEMGDGVAVAAEDAVQDGHEIKAGTIVELEPDQIQLDHAGEATYRWTGGMPNLTAPYLRTMNISTIVVDKSVNWLPQSMAGVVLGVVPTGNNFITAGPSYVDMVLRDPPGSSSTATWGTDTVSSKYSYSTHGTYGGAHLKVKYSTGLELINSFGLGVATIITSKLKHEETVDVGADLSEDWTNARYTTYTNSHSVTTSSAATFVGADGDVFIGHSTNFIIGAANEVDLMPQEDGTYKLGNDRCISMGEEFATQFNYTQKYIEGTLIPNIKATRNSKLKHVNSLTEIEEHPSVPTYYTLLDENDPNFGSSNDDEEVWGELANDGSTGEMPSYYFRTPLTYNGCDSVKWLNESVRLWEAQLSLNEQDKVEAFSNEAKYKQGNVSFEWGETVSASAATDSVRKSDRTFKFKAGGVWNSLGGWETSGTGWQIETSVTAGYNYTRNTVDEKKFKQVFSYNLNDNNKGEAHTVDIYKSPRNWGTIFRTRAGQTRCPYEPEARTKYFEKGKHILNYGTMKVDNPKVDMPERNIVNIPAGQQTNVKLWLTNESETQFEYNIVNLYLDPVSNPDGLVVLLDGAPLSQANEIWIPYGQTLEQTLTIYQSNPAILDYNDIKLQLISPCQPDKTFDEITFSAHFVPAAPAVTLHLDKNILNQNAVRAGEKILATISDINRHFTGLQGVRLKYRFIGDNTWTTAHDWVTSEQYLSEGHETDVQTLMPAEVSSINYELSLPSFDGRYLVKAESYCSPSVVNATDEQEVILDTRGPKLLGQAYPNMGILKPTDDIYARFNESIRESYLTKDENFSITGVLNDSPINHEVSLQLNGQEISTESYMSINDEDFSLSFWLKRQSGGRLLKHGTDDNYIAMEITDDGRAVLDMSGNKMISDKTIPADKWVFIGANFHQEDDHYFNLFYELEGQVIDLFEDTAIPPYTSVGRFSVGNEVHGAMHQLSLWNKTATKAEILENKLKNFPPYTPGIVAYWKMDEGHGLTVHDYARQRNMKLTSEQWNIDNVNLAAHLDGTTSLKADISRMNSRSTDSYLIETWFRGVPDSNVNATLFSITDNMSIGFGENGEMLLRTYDNGDLSSMTTWGNHFLITENDYCDGNWHHFALNVHRGVSAVVYIDGQAVRTLSEQVIPAPRGDYLYIGSMQRQVGSEIQDQFFFKGDIDEVRIWSVATDATTVTSQCYSMVDTASAVGLVGYFPMQRTRLDNNGNIVTEFSLENKVLPMFTLIPTHAMPTQAMTAPALKSAPDEQNIDFDFSASDREIYITLRERPSRLHGNVINFRLKNVRDDCDNLSENITWSAVADYNTLEWLVPKVEISVDRLDTYTLNATLCNTGSRDETYSLSGNPSWLLMSPTEGNIDLGSNANIRFTLQAGAPVGRHDVVIYARNSEEVYTPMLLVIDVKGNEPSWDVDVSQYESSMNIIGQFYLDDKIDQNPNTKVAAFVNGQCRGVASPQLMVSRDAYFVNLTVYGDDDMSLTEPVVFKIYSGNEGVVYDEVITLLNNVETPVNFQPNALIGTYDTPLIWVVGDKIEQTINFRAGWNWISFYVDPYEKPMGPEQAFGHDIAFKRINSKNDGFSLCDGNGWLGSLDHLDAGKMYKVRLTDNVTTHVNGTYIDPRETPQEIHNGWNWIGPLSIYNLTIDEAFADLGPQKGDVVKSKERISIYNGYKWEGLLNAIIPGEGYYYYSNDDDKSFFYPSGRAKKNAPLREMPEDTWSPFTPVPHQNFSDNMNVIANLWVQDERVDTAVVAAFIDGQCRGIVRAKDGIYFLTIAGNADESGKKVQFRTFIDGEVYAADSYVTFVSDALVGDLDDLYPIRVNTSGVNEISMNDAIIKITPTLTSGIVNILSTEQLAHVAVYSAGGALIHHSSYATSNEQYKSSIDLSGNAPGVYFIEVVTSGGQRRVERVILTPGL